LDKIGRGSTSTVHKVERLSDGKIMAAKIFLKSFLESKEKRWESVLNEISILRVLEHRSNILKLHNVYESKSAIYLITDLFEGGNLLERINCLRGLNL
jgi:serine/threonine protein kinase